MTLDGERAQELDDLHDRVCEALGDNVYDAVRPIIADAVMPIVEELAQRAEQAEAAVERVRSLAAEAKEHAEGSLSGRDITGKPFAALVLADDVLAALNQPKETPDA